MKVFYTRISTASQNMDRQLVNVPEGAKVYSDTISGTTKFSERPEGAKLLKAIEKGKVTSVTTDAVDRLGRDLIDVLSTIEFLEKNKCQLIIQSLGVSLYKDNGIKDPTFDIVIAVMGSMAKAERERMLERQKQGIAVAKAQGKYKGRPKGIELTDEELLHKHKDVVKYFNQKLSIRDTAKLCKKSSTTITKIYKILRENQ